MRRVRRTSDAHRDRKSLGVASGRRKEGETEGGEKLTEEGPRVQDRDPDFPVIRLTLAPRPCLCRPVGPAPQGPYRPRLRSRPVRSAVAGSGGPVRGASAPHKGLASDETEGDKWSRGERIAPSERSERKGRMSTFRLSLEFPFPDLLHLNVLILDELVFFLD